MVDLPTQPAADVCTRVTKPVEVQTVTVTTVNVRAVEIWVRGYAGTANVVEGQLVIGTWDGDEQALPGDVITYDRRRGFSVFRPDEFTDQHFAPDDQPASPRERIDGILDRFAEQNGAR